MSGFAFRLLSNEGIRAGVQKEYDFFRPIVKSDHAAIYHL